MLKNKLKKIKFIIFLFQFTFICIGHTNPYSKLLNVKDYDIRDFKFELIIKNLKKHLANYYPLEKLKDFKIKVFWLKGGKLNIVLDNLPPGKNQIENEIKLRVLNLIRVFFPKDEIKPLSEVYTIKKSDKNITATNNESLVFIVILF